jgi:hypothetical protein
MLRILSEAGQPTTKQQIPGLRKYGMLAPPPKKDIEADEKAEGYRKAKALTATRFCGKERFKDSPLYLLVDAYARIGEKKDGPRASDRIEAIGNGFTGEMD